MSKSTIISKAMRCIDEVTANAPIEEGLFPTDVFFCEALRWVIDVVPLHQLGEGEMLVLGSLNVSDGVGSGLLPDDFARLISFKANDWSRAVVTPIYDTDPQYIQQSSRVLRGKPSRPVVAICKGKTVLEYYTTTLYGDAYTAQYIPYDVISIPPHLEDMVAWKLAEIVLLSISDANAAAVCSARVKDILTEMTV